MKLDIPYLKLWSDWTTQEVDTIETDNYKEFSIVKRYGDNSWYLIGHKYRKDLERWEEDEWKVAFLSDIVCLYDKIKDKILTIRSYTKGSSLVDFMKAYQKHVVIQMLVAQ